MDRTTDGLPANMRIWNEQILMQQLAGGKCSEGSTSREGNMANKWLQLLSLRINWMCSSRERRIMSIPHTDINHVVSSRIWHAVQCASGTVETRFSAVNVSSLLQVSDLCQNILLQVSSVWATSETPQMRIFITFKLWFGRANPNILHGFGAIWPQKLSEFQTFSKVKVTGSTFDSERAFMRWHCRRGILPHKSEKGINLQFERLSSSRVLLVFCVDKRKIAFTTQHQSLWSCVRMLIGNHHYSSESTFYRIPMFLPWKKVCLSNVYAIMGSCSSIDCKYLLFWQWCREKQDKASHQVPPIRLNETRMFDRLKDFACKWSENHVCKTVPISFVCKKQLSHCFRFMNKRKERNTAGPNIHTQWPQWKA